MNKLIDFYKETLGFENYYSIIANKIKENPNEHIDSKRFLDCIQLKNETISNVGITSSDGDIRVDAPVWFGNLNISSTRIIVFGLEPRDTDSKFNIEKVGKQIYGTPFGVDRWNEKSSVKRKPQNKYYRVFQDLINTENVFLVFSDIVKSYNVIKADNDKKINDLYARENFFKFAELEKKDLLKELELINPTHIVTLGNNAHRAVKKIIPNHDNIFELRHPSYGGEKKAKEQLSQLLTKVNLQ